MSDYPLLDRLRAMHNTDATNAAAEIDRLTRELFDRRADLLHIRDRCDAAPRELAIPAVHRILAERRDAVTYAVRIEDAADKVIAEAIGALDCRCSLKERQSGHLVGCYVPALDDAIQAYGAALAKNPSTPGAGAPCGNPAALTGQADDPVPQANAIPVPADAGRSETDDVSPVLSPGGSVAAQDTRQHTAPATAPHIPLGVCKCTTGPIGCGTCPQCGKERTPSQDTELDWREIDRRYTKVLCSWCGGTMLSAKTPSQCNFEEKP